jgi:sugar lactone lactonase YvrE/two-component sensor histidine kinase
MPWPKTPRAAYGGAEGYPNTKSKALFFDRLGRLWMGTEGDGLYVRSGDKTLRLGLDNGLRGNWIRDVVQDEAGNIWVAKAGGGISCLRETAPLRFDMEHYDQRNGLPDDRINQLLCEGPRIWFVTAGHGAGFIENGRIQSIDKSRGLPSDHLRSIAQRGNEIWLGTEDAGIVRVSYENGRWNTQALTTQQGLRSNTIYLLHADTRGHLWVGSEKGVDALEWNSSGNLVKVRHYGAGEGFTGVETSQNAVVLDRSGKLWFGTINGMTSCNPNQGGAPLQAPVLRITQMTVGNQAIENSRYATIFDGWNTARATLRLPGSGSAFGLSFHAIGYPNPDLVQYQWKLEGADGGWSKASTQNNISFSALEPGDYRLCIRAANEVGQWSKPLYIPLHVNTPYWRNPWLIGAAFVGLLVLVWAVMRWRIGRIRRKAAAVQEKLRMESELIRLEQKALQLQMNPHFIFNALNSVQALIGSADEKTARYQLARFSKLMRLILEGSREEQLSLAQEMQMLENYLNLEQFIRGGHFQFSIEARGGYQTEEVMLPAMMVHPFVENAVVHGLSGIDAGQLKIHFEVSETHVEVCIEDNGRGRAAAALLRRERDPEHKSTALKVVAERLSLSGTGAAPRVEDLNDADGKACGTRVWLHLPVKHVF